jgi:hypothetical protein
MKAVRCNSAYALSEDEVCESNKYNFKATVIQNIIYVYSFLDLWLVQKDGDKKFYLYHQNKKLGNKNYHFQQEFSNLDDTFEYIHKHDEFVLKMKWTLPAGLKNAYRKARRRGKA